MKLSSSFLLGSLATLLLFLGSGTAWLVEDYVHIQRWYTRWEGEEACTPPYHDLSDAPQLIDNSGGYCYMNPVGPNEFTVVHWFRSARESNVELKDTVFAYTLILNETSPNYQYLLPDCSDGGSGLCICGALDEKGFRDLNHGGICSGGGSKNGTVVLKQNETQTDILSCTIEPTSGFEAGFTGCGADILVDGGDYVPSFFSPINAMIQVEYLSMAPTSAPTAHKKHHHSSAAGKMGVVSPLVSVCLLGLLVITNIVWQI